MLTSYLAANKAEEARAGNLLQYYRGNSAIKRRQWDDTSKPCNKVANPYATHLTNTAVGYFVGKPITYTIDNDTINQIIRYNDDASENATLARWASICGYAYELLYIDTDGQVRYRAISPTSAFLIVSNDMDAEPLYFVRHWTDEDIVSGNTVQYVEVYTQSEIRLYRQAEGEMENVSVRLHNFGLVPVAIYANNDELLGDFEGVISLIDAYDSVQSDSVDAMDYFSDCYLTLTGMSGTDADDIRAMKTNRVLLLDDGGQAAFLTKNANDAAEENLKSRLQRDIHKLSSIPDITEEGFATTSGIALRYKLIAFETLTAAKETLFRRGLQRRFELICAILRLMGQDVDYRDITITFTRNLPVDTEEIANILNSAGHLLSKQTQLALLPYDIDVPAEIERKKAEDEAGYDNYTELTHNE